MHRRAVEALEAHPAQRPQPRELALAPFAIVLGIFALGLWVFNRAAPLAAENL